MFAFYLVKEGIKLTLKPVTIPASYFFGNAWNTVKEDNNKNGIATTGASALVAGASIPVGSSLGGYLATLSGPAILKFLIGNGLIYTLFSAPILGLITLGGSLVVSGTGIYITYKGTKKLICSVSDLRAMNKIKNDFPSIQGVLFKYPDLYRNVIDTDNLAKRIDLSWDILESSTFNIEKQLNKDEFIKLLDVIEKNPKSLYYAAKNPSDLKKLIEDDSIIKQLDKLYPKGEKELSKIVKELAPKVKDDEWEKVNYSQVLDNSAVISVYPSLAKKILNDNKIAKEVYDCGFLLCDQINIQKELSKAKDFLKLAKVVQKHPVALLRLTTNPTIAKFLINSSQSTLKAVLSDEVYGKLDMSKIRQIVQNILQKSSENKYRKAIKLRNELEELEFYDKDTIIVNSFIPKFDNTDIKTLGRGCSGNQKAIEWKKSSPTKELFFIKDKFINIPIKYDSKKIEMLDSNHFETKLASKIKKEQKTPEEKSLVRSVLGYFGY